LTVYIILGVASLLLLLRWQQTRRRTWLFAIVIVAGLAGLYFLLDRLVETGREQIERKLKEMAAGVQARNAEGIFTHISDQFRMGGLDKPTFRRFVDQVLRDRQITELEVWQFEVPPTPRSTQLVEVGFLVKPKGGITGNAAHYRCQAHFLRDSDGQWRLRDFQIFNPFVETNQPIEIPQLPR
jgi:hypothetical protein